MIKKVLSLMGKKKTPDELFKDIYRCLDLFIDQESKLWGTQLQHLKNQQEDTLEDINHIVYKFQSLDEKALKEMLKSKDVEDVISELLNVYEEIKHLKKLINRQEVFKNTLNSLTLLLVNEETYQYFEDIFLLEKQLQQVIIWQEEEFKQLFKDSQDIKNAKDLNFKSELLYQKLIQMRQILAGNLDHHDLWRDEMQGFSNCSNILHALKAKIMQIQKYHDDNKVA